MKAGYSYAAQIKSGTIKHDLDTTRDVYREALSYLIRFYDAQWEKLSLFKGKLRNNAAERMVHSTSKNAAVCDFDKKFPKFPCYLRRAAIQTALGIVSSYRTNHKNWEEGGKKGSEPKLCIYHAKLPCFYDAMMFQETSDICTIRLKLYVNRDWVWREARLLATDVKYLRENTVWSTHKSPTLEYRYGVYYLRFAFEEEVSLSDKPLSERRICAVDLGLNNDAVCSILTSDGTVLGRKFINFPSEKDQLYRVLGRIRKQQREHGNGSVSGLWAYAKRLNEELGKKVSAAIVRYAASCSADVIVFEHLDIRGKKRGGKKQKLHMWKKSDIQNRVELNAHRAGMRISRVCAWGTSKLAFDGSGEVFRGRVNLTKGELNGLISRRENDKSLGKYGRPETYCGKDLCTFTNGKEYHCDLSASYNIGARYFLRELCKGNPSLEENLPKTTLRTYADLRNLRLHKAA